MNPASLVRFKEIYQQEYGTSLSEKDAFDLATNLAQLYQLVYGDNSQKNINQEYEKKLPNTQN